MATRAKFKCHEIAIREGNSRPPDSNVVYAAKLSAVYTGSPENAEFFASTPSGSIEISTVRNDHFKVGKSYYVDFTEAES